VDVKWVAVKDDSGTLMNASDQIVHAINNTITQFASHPETLYKSCRRILDFPQKHQYWHKILTLTTILIHFDP
jgi:hypothetical protein